MVAPWLQQCFLCCGYWPGAGGVTQIYVRLHHRTDTVILKLLEIPHDVNNLRLMTLPHAMSLYLKHNTFRSILQIKWDTCLGLNVDGEVQNIFMPTTIKVPCLLRTRTRAAAKGPCNMLILFNTNQSPVLKAMDDEQIGELLANILPTIATDSVVAKLGYQIPHENQSEDSPTLAFPQTYIERSRCPENDHLEAMSLLINPSLDEASSKL